MKKTKQILKLVLIFVAIGSLLSCKKLADDQKSATLLLVQQVLGHTDGGTEALFLQSDVQDVDQTTMAATVLTDTASVTLAAELKAPDSINGPSIYNNITLTGYTISYALPDGTGVAGTDVPLTIENSLSTIMVNVGGTTTISIPVVLDSAKLQPPLAALIGTTNTLQVNATITFTGEDVDHNLVTAVGHLTIYFADYAEAASGS